MDSEFEKHYQETLKQFSKRFNGEIPTEYQLKTYNMEPPGVSEYLDNIRKRLEDRKNPVG